MYSYCDLPVRSMINNKIPNNHLPNTILPIYNNKKIYIDIIKYNCLMLTFQTLI